MELNLKRIDKYKVVTFDVFDTLLKREVYKPTDIFHIVQKEAKRRYGFECDFKAVRMEAERKAREKSKYPDVTLDEIYEEIDIDNKDEFKGIELEIERTVLHCNFDLKKVYDYCLQSGKEIYLISDMYLSSYFLGEILGREGYVGYKDIIISSEHRNIKRSGKLFKDFLTQYSINKKDVIHIGDSWYADYIGPRKASIKGIHIPRVVKNTLYTPKPDKNTSYEARTLFSFTNLRVGEFESRAERLGYEVLGPILYAYCKWIHDFYEGCKTDQSKLWFAARDMYLFKQAYESMYGDSKIDYMYISRRSLRPILTYMTRDITESGKAFPRGKYTIQEIIQKMGYKINDLDDEIYDKEARYDIRKLEEYPEVKRLLGSERILAKERELAKHGVDYLRGNGLFDSNIMLADVGWHGTTQYILRRIQESASDQGNLFGLYLGCLDSTNDRIGRDNYKSFAFNEEEISDFGKGTVLFEALILAPHGSTREYKDNNGEVEPVLGEPDNVSDYLLTVQSGALKFVSEFSHSMVGQNVTLDAATATRAFCNLALSPLREELNTIGQLDYEDLGTRKMAAPEPMTRYLMHPKKFYHDLKYSPWRVGFLYSLFKVRLPYAKLYSLARKRQGKMT